MVSFSSIVCVRRSHTVAILFLLNYMNAFAASSKESTVQPDDIVDGGLLPVSQGDFNPCESQGRDDLISTNYNSESQNKYCSGAGHHKSSANSYAPSSRGQEILSIIKAKEDQYNTQESKSSEERQDSICQHYLKLIAGDLIPFLAAGVSREMTDAAISRGGVLYQIINGKLYRTNNCNFPSRCSGVEHFLQKLAKTLPDVEFVINVSDWPQIPTWSSTPVPVFSFSKSSDYMDIIYPAWTFWAGGPAISIYPKGIGRWDMSRKSLIASANKMNWSSKKSVAFFRGSRTSAERDPLILISRRYPELADAQYTKNQAWKSDQDTLNAPAAAEVTFEEHCDYKYLFNYRGVSASFRFKHLFLCRSLVFHVGQEWIEFFYPALKPWIHYVPVDKNASEEDLRFIIDFFRQNDDVASRIATRGFNFIADNLKLDHVLCYWKNLLSSYAKLIRYKVQLRTDVVVIP